MILYRQRQWRTMLRRFADTEHGKAFVWGETDCASLARRALVSMFGAALEDRFPTPWNSALTAQTALESAVSVDAWLRSIGAVVHPINFMRAGDIVVQPELEEIVGQIAVMVCIDGTECLTTGKQSGVSFTRVPRDATIYSLWEVVLDG